MLIRHPESGPCRLNAYVNSAVGGQLAAAGGPYLQDFKAHNRLGLFRNKPPQIAPHQP
jgi:hypothetical protein